MEAGSAALRVDRPVYPRRAEHNIVAEGGNRDGRARASERGHQRKSLALVAGSARVSRPPCPVARRKAVAFAG